jgi:hypothetical protein
MGHRTGCDRLFAQPCPYVVSLDLDLHAWTAIAVGADFFCFHLVDGDVASYMLGWRWTAGLHKRGKPYPADAKKNLLYHQALSRAAAIWQWRHRG